MPLEPRRCDGLERDARPGWLSNTQGNRRPRKRTANSPGTRSTSWVTTVWRNVATQLILVTKILHIAFAAAWFGHKLLIPRDVRQSIHNPAESPGLIQRMARAERLGIASGFGTLLTGIGLIMLTDGFAETPLRIYVGLGAVLAMFAVGALVGSPAWRGVRGGLEADDLPRAASRMGSLIGALRLEGVLWILALTTMLI